MTQSRAFIVSGRVQGVGFRWWVREQAAALGLAGSVRNLPEGTVAVEAVGPPDLLDRFEALLWQGPPAARVDQVRAHPSNGPDPGAGFRIAR
jgi:acylphosphatase